ncbi:MAG: hypothetical protein ACR2PO_18075 [Methyloligellaceae bacterium]
MLKKTTNHVCPDAVTCDNRSCQRRPAFEIVKGPEHLVGIGFRCWMAGYMTSDINCWEVGWSHYARTLGAQQAKAAVTELACWVRAVRSRAARDIEVYPADCAGFCRDECMAISMIAAAQQNACPAMRACAFALIGDSLVDEVVNTAEGFAHVLGDVGVRLAPESVVQSPALASQAELGRPN